MSAAVEFSRFVPLDRLRRGEVTQKIDADADECAAIAARLRLEAVAALSAEFTLRPAVQPGLYQVEGEAKASITQLCVVSGDPFAAEVTATIRALFSESAEIDGDSADEEWDDIEPIEEGRIDIGELAVQHISLNLDLYPRKPGAEFANSNEEEKPQSPFAILKTLKKDD